MKNSSAFHQQNEENQKGTDAKKLKQHVKGEENIIGRPYSKRGRGKTMARS